MRPASHSPEDAPREPQAPRPGRTTLSRRLRVLLDRWQPPEDVVFVLTALFVGLATGVGAVAFRYLIRFVAWVGFEKVPQLTGAWGGIHVVIVPTVGGLLVGLLVWRFAPEAKGHGVPEVMEAVALRGGRIRPVVALIKSLASSICIGSGGSVGREGPIVQIGSSLGSSTAQLLHLSEDRTANLVACGAAGGIAATFNAPIAGVIFALEVILGGRFSVRYFSTVVVSAVSASVVGRIAFGDTAAFSIPTEYGVHSLWEFLLYPVLGVLAALTGAAFVRSLYWLEDLFDDWDGPPPWSKPAIGGLLLGLLALAYPAVTPVAWNGNTPQIFNVGYEIIESALANELTLVTLATLLVLKLLATGLTLGSGGSGGVFAPSLFMGAMLGGAFELVANQLFPGITAPAGAYALVGMGAVFSASAHAPITAVLILFELTGDYRIMLPLMLTVVIATLLAQRLLADESIYTLKLSRRGVRLQRGRDVDLLEGVEVSEAMVPDVDTVPGDMSLSDLLEVFTSRRRRAVLTLDPAGKLQGIVTDTDLDVAVDAGKSMDTPVAEIATTWPDILCAFPDETMGAALARMGTRGIGRLPVVSRQDPRQLLGIIRRQDIIRAYDLASTRRAEIHRQAERLGAGDEAHFVDIFLSPGDRTLGMSVREIGPGLPPDSLLVSIRRDGRLIIPRGDTRLAVGDHVTVFARRDNEEQVRRCLTGRGAEVRS